MANHTTGAQRYNDRMDKIFAKSEKQGHHTLHGSTESKSKALEGKKKDKSHLYIKASHNARYGESRDERDAARADMKKYK